MSGLTLFGLFAVTAMLVCYALEKRNPWFNVDSTATTLRHAGLSGIWKKDTPEEK